MKQSYIVVHEKDYLRDFVSQVNIRLNSGYSLVGGIAVDSDGYYQAMIKIEYDSADDGRLMMEDLFKVL